jgi:F0F1-type ATP synthase membrane subunit b/b'
MKFAVPALQKGMAARSEKVRTDLGAAEKAKADADTLLADYRRNSPTLATSPIA